MPPRKWPVLFPTNSNQRECSSGFQTGGLSITRSINIAFAIAAILIGVSVTSRVSYGGLLDSVGGMLNNNNSPSVGPPTEELERNLSSLDVRFAGAMREMLTAQSITADALGDKASADKLATEAAALEGKTDINTVERSISISEEAAKTNQEKMAAAGALNQQAKAELATAAGHYARGMVQAAGLPREYQNWLNGAKAKANSIKANPLKQWVLLVFFETWSMSFL